MNTLLHFIIPMKTVSENALRAMSWQKRSLGDSKTGWPGTKSQKHDAFHWTLSKLTPTMRTRVKNGEGKILVTLCRIGPKELDSDNNVGACKAVRDGIAEAFDVDDGSPRYQWAYGQKRGKTARDYGVEVHIRF